MIKLENYEVIGWEHAIRGMRNPMNSWEKSDSGFVCYANDQHFCSVCEDGHTDACPERFRTYKIGPNDRELMMKLAKAGSVHAKYRRMITVYVDITAPLYWWKEFDTYKVGTVANSCSTMHKIHAKEFELEDFSCEKLISMTSDRLHSEIPFVEAGGLDESKYTPLGVIKCMVIPMLNECRSIYLETKDKIYWDQMIQLLPSSYNQKRTIMLNYEVLVGMYRDRKNHKLDEWREFCKWVEQLPYSEIITGGFVNA